MATLAVDTPATIAVLGAGPIGLEAALYARFLGYDVNIYERGTVAENLRRVGHLRLFTPFGLNRSPLGLAALEAQDPNWRPPADDTLQTAAEFVESYLIPLSQTDLLADSLRPGMTAVAVGREELLEHELLGSPERAKRQFKLLLQDAQNEEQVATADVVLDATGTFGADAWIGDSGLPDGGERPFAGFIEHGLPDILGAAPGEYGGKHTLVVGAGYSAATNVIALARLAEDHPGTRITWITRRPAESASQAPIALIADDPLAQRDRIAREANELARSGDVVRHLPGVTVEALRLCDDALEVTLSGASGETPRVDRILANTGFRADPRLNEALQLDMCCETGAPSKLAAALRAQTSPDGLTLSAAGPDALIHPEPNFYILGAKSYGGDSRFFIKHGHEQIRDVFTLIGDRADLDLYRVMHRG